MSQVYPLQQSQEYADFYKDANGESLRRSNQSSELVYSAGDDTKRWLNTEERGSTGVKSPVTTNLQESPMRGSSGGVGSLMGQAILGNGTFRRHPINGSGSLPQSGVSSRIAGIGNVNGDST